MDFPKKLIKLVSLNKVLYDIEDDNYRNVMEKERIWEDISQRLNKSVLECKTKWKNLRCSYRRVKNDRKRASRSSSKRPRRKWAYEDQMCFLEEFHSTGNTKGEEFECSENGLIDEIDPKEEIFEDSFDEAEETSIPDRSAPTYTPMPCPSTYESEKQHNQQVQNPDFEELLNPITEAIKEVATAMDRGNNSATTSLFLALAKRIDESSLPANVIADIELEVINLVYEKIKEYKK